MTHKKQKMSEEINELTTVVEYYKLYQSASTTPPPPPATTDPPTNAIDNNTSFWSEQEEWTTNHETTLQSKINQNQSKCDIVSSSPNGRYIVNQYEKDACLNWENFYRRNKTNFFKDRHYLAKAFPREFHPLYWDEVMEKGEDGTSGNDENDTQHETNLKHDDDDYVYVEIGCGVGNAVLPLLERSTLLAKTQQIQNNNPPPSKKISVWGFDFSSVAIDLLHQDERFIQAQKDGRAKAAVWDITCTSPHDILLSQEGNQTLYQKANVAMLLFCLSAINPTKMKKAALHASQTLKPGGILCFRDYGRYDEAQMKLSSQRNKKLDSPNFYVKSDGTRCYYFTIEDVEGLFGEAGLEVLELKYIRRIYKNFGEGGAERRRVWVQGRFRKPF